MPRAIVDLISFSALCVLIVTPLATDAQVVVTIIARHVHRATLPSLIQVLLAILVVLNAINAQQAMSIIAHHVIRLQNN